MIGENQHENHDRVLRAAVGVVRLHVVRRRARWPLGYSVYQTTYQQIADKQVAANPGTELPAAGADGPLLEKVINGYRGVTGDAQQVGQPIQIQVTDSTR